MTVSHPSRESPETCFPHTNRYLRRAQALDPDLPDVYAEASSYQFACQWNWAEADRAWGRAEAASHGALQPDLLRARALQRWALGDTTSAIALVRRARTSDPLATVFAMDEADYLLDLGHLDAAAALYAGVVRTAPGDSRAWFGLSEARRRQARFDESVAACRRAVEARGETFPASLVEGAATAATLERLDAFGAMQELARLEQRQHVRYVSPLDEARAHARLGHEAEAMAALELALEEHAPGLAFLNVDRVWDRLAAPLPCAASWSAWG